MTAVGPPPAPLRPPGPCPDPYPTPLTWLYVPGDRPNAVAKALGCGADVVLVDLADAVAPYRKEYALRATAELLAEASPGPAPVHVRVNALDGPLAETEIRTLSALPGLAGLRLPKVHHPADIHRAAAWATAAPRPAPDRPAAPDRPYAAQLPYDPCTPHTAPLMAPPFMTPVTLTPTATPRAEAAVRPAGSAPAPTSLTPPPAPTPTPAPTATSAPAPAPTASAPPKRPDAPARVPHLYALLESALGIEHAFAIATAHPALRGIALGEADLRAELGLREEAGLAWPRSRAVVAARAAGLPPPPQSVYPDARDLDGLARSCADGRALGFLGRAAIHPRQLPVIEAAHRPCAQEIEAAEEIVRAATSDAGAVALSDGRFVDPAVVAGARRVLALAYRYR
ncbi:HpcH/HpaI aldolase/citrate lyase family protein [Streptomyces kasugaensis]|uniref:HpcH/HpaI aldolase/citrate lyase family protein n=1 Tax=Streptomyces kasugaensis TaxID=1946 RepID=UPI0031454A0E